MGDTERLNDVFRNIGRVEDQLGLLFNKLDELVVATVKNTVILKEHHVRSTRLEGVVEDISTMNNNVRVEVAKLHIEIAEIHADMKPIKSHVHSLGWVLAFTKWTPKVIKITLSLVTIMSASVGVYYTINYLMRE